MGHKRTTWEARFASTNNFPWLYIPGIIYESPPVSDDKCRNRIPQLSETAYKPILRFDTMAIHAAINARWQARGITWAQVLKEIGC